MGASLPQHRIPSTGGTSCGNREPTVSFDRREALAQIIVSRPPTDSGRWCEATASAITAAEKPPGYDLQHRSGARTLTRNEEKTKSPIPKLKSNALGREQIFQHRRTAGITGVGRDKCRRALSGNTQSVGMAISHTTGSTAGGGRDGSARRSEARPSAGSAPQDRAVPPRAMLCSQFRRSPEAALSYKREIALLSSRKPLLLPLINLSIGMMRIRNDLEESSELAHLPKSGAGAYKTERLTPPAGREDCKPADARSQMCANNSGSRTIRRSWRRQKSARHPRRRHGLASIHCAPRTHKDRRRRHMPRTKQILTPDFRRQGGLFETPRARRRGHFRRTITFVTTVRLCKAQRYRYKHNDSRSEAKLTRARTPARRSDRWLLFMDGTIGRLGHL